jgi:hypothetical protein
VPYRRVVPRVSKKDAYTRISLIASKVPYSSFLGAYRIFMGEIVTSVFCWEFTKNANATHAWKKNAREKISGVLPDCWAKFTTAWLLREWLTQAVLVGFSELASDLNLRSNSRR